MNKLPTFALLAIAITTIPAIAPAGDKGMEGAVARAAEAGFSELERRLIREYLGRYGVETDRDDEKHSGKGKNKSKDKKGLPPGLANKDELPPGLARQLQKNGTLPPGLAKRDLPGGLQNRLPPPPDGYERSIIEDAAIVLVEKATGRIADIIADVVIKND